MQSVTPSSRLIVALDVSTGKQALELVAKLENSVNFFKIGLELMASGDGLQVIDQLAADGYHIFADFKLLDIPQTVYRTVKNLNDRGIDFLTVHAEPQAMEAAVDAAADVRVLAVTVLTSLQDNALRRMGFELTLEKLVRLRTIHAHEAGCAGVIASPLEAKLIREDTHGDLLIVTPGIRGPDEPANDQKRTLNIDGALAAGVDFVVIGRSIRDANSPKDVAIGFQNRIHKFEQSLHQ